MRSSTIVLIAALMAPVASAQDYTRDYDRFKDKTSYAVKIELSALSRTSPSIDFGITSAVQGDAPVTDKDTLSLDMMVTYNMSTNRACAGAGIDILADGKPMTLESAMPPILHGGFAITTYSKKQTLAEATAFTSSESIELRACNQEFQLDDAQRAKLADFIRAIQQAPPEVGH